MFVSVAITFIPSLTMCSEGSPRSLLFRCCREIPSVNQKLTFDKRISCITRPDDFSPRSHPNVSLQVAPFLKDCKGRGYRLRWKTSEYIVIWFMLISKRDLIEKKFFSLSVALPYDPFRPREITDISIINEYFVWIDFHTALGFGTICFNKICVSIFILLQCCYRNDIATITTFSSSEQGGIDGWWDGFAET